MTRFAIYERVQGSHVKTWECDAVDVIAAKRLAMKVGLSPIRLDEFPAVPATKQPKKKRKGKG